MDEKSLDSVFNLPFSEFRSEMRQAQNLNIAQKKPSKYVFYKIGHKSAKQIFKK
jgi:hypothetical protein